MVPLVLGPLPTAILHARVTGSEKTKKKNAVPACNQTRRCGVSVIDGSGLARPRSHAKLSVQVVGTECAKRQREIYALGMDHAQLRTPCWFCNCEWRTVSLSRVPWYTLGYHGLYHCFFLSLDQSHTSPCKAGTLVCINHVDTDVVNTSFSPGKLRGRCRQCFMPRSCHQVSNPTVLLLKTSPSHALSQYPKHGPFREGWVLVDGKRHMVRMVSPT